MKAPQGVRITTLVACDAERAFRVFTEDVDSWWKHGPRYRFGENRTGVMKFEPRVGGRFLEVFDEAADDVYEVGRVLAWEPGRRLVFEFRARDFAAGESTEVEVLFRPEQGKTRVSVEHRGWERIPDEHRVRHGLTGPAFVAMMGNWWSDLLVSLHAGSTRPPGK